MEEKKEKRVLTIELDENVKKVSITGLGDDETVVMKQELTEEELEQATGGMGVRLPSTCPLYGYGGADPHSGDNEGCHDSNICPFHCMTDLCIGKERHHTNCWYNT